MATARFTYTTDAGNFFNLVMDKDTVLDTVRGTGSTSALTENMTIKLSKNNKEVGITPRYTIFAREIGTNTSSTTCLIDTGKKYKFVPSLTEAAWDAVVTDASANNQTTFTQNGATYKAVRKVRETVK